LEEDGMTIYLEIPVADLRNTADASMNYRERTGVLVASSTSSADTGNLAAATKNSTFQCGPASAMPTVELPRSQATAAKRF
jgi:hypothetical protein